MAHANFVHLRVHSAYSLSEGAIHVKEIAKQCVGHAMPAVAITDTNNMFGALEASTVLPEAGVQPIVGCALNLAYGTDDPVSGRKAPLAPVAFLVQSAIGYANLMKIVSRAHLSSDPASGPHVTLEALGTLSDGLILLTGGAVGPLGRLLQDGQDAAAEALLLTLKGLFPERLYIELQRHDLDAEHATEEAFIELAYRHDVPLVATNDVYYTKRALFEAHDALLCIAEGAYVSQDDRRRLTPEHYFKSADEMRTLFADLPEAVDNTMVIARRCAFKVPKIDPILPKFTSGEGISEADSLREEARVGLEEHLANHVWTEDMSAETREEVAIPYRERLEFELGVIIKMDFPGYFLIVSDFIRWAKRHKIPVGPGRGSGAGSVVAWALKITDLDPLRWGLLFERFLNPERVSMPDFDVDFCQDRRDEVIRYVQQKYGHAQVAQIITFGKLQARAVLRDVGRVLQLSYGQVDRICKMIPNNPAAPVTLAEALIVEPRLRQERDSDPAVARMIDVALKLEGLYRHASTHAAGVVIGDRPLENLVPLYRDPRSDMPVTQFNMKWVESAGLVKFDFLGLKTLTVLQRALDLLAQRGVMVDLGKVPLTDEKTFELLAKGVTVGVFQLESTGMRSALTQLKPDSFEDIIAMVSLYRPGPMDNIPSYIKRKHGQETPDYLHPSLEPILKETYGVIIYQEQVMQIAQVLADYSLGEADLLRRAMGKKIPAEMDQQRVRFVEGAERKGVKKDQASYIFDLVAKFAGYGFNKSHAAAYALVAYHTAYLKANYPVEFLAASMTYDMTNTDKLDVFKQEAGKLGIPVLPPDLTASEATFSVEPTKTEEGEEKLAVRYALGAIKNVGVQAMEGVVRERKDHGRFKDVADFSTRLDPKLLNKRTLENLSKAGAFDNLLPNRAQAFAAVDLIVRHAQVAAEERTSQQTSLFGGSAAEPASIPLPAAAEWSLVDRLRAEFEAVGFYLSAHPLDAYAQTLKRERVYPSGELMRLAQSGAGVARVAGTLQSMRERRTKSGKPMAHLMLSDASGAFEVTLFEEILNSARSILNGGQSLVISCEIRLDGETLRLTGNSVESIDRVAERSGRGLRVFINSSSPIQSLKTILERAKGGRGNVTLVASLDHGEREVELSLPGRYAISPPVRNAVMAVSGVVDAEEL
ncbi:DNA polymerase III subunit alpha [Govanella unica]|uniref:DNA polymerase III subunit alpha n=1 Tax=Govanella unica TaxID=2975056 RepID=A0A9X3TY96_9PROT|nr:DNA polymerase III subunit alpha [Govania unica]MDA5193764.1 DNA polymerase III subunit alpha [Govania unica]